MSLYTIIGIGKVGVETLEYLSLCNKSWELLACTADPASYKFSLLGNKVLLPPDLSQPDSRLTQAIRSVVKDSKVIFLVGNPNQKCDRQAIILIAHLAYMTGRPVIAVIASFTNGTSDYSPQDQETIRALVSACYGVSVLRSSKKL